MRKKIMCVFILVCLFIVSGCNKEEKEIVRIPSTTTVSQNEESTTMITEIPSTNKNIEDKQEITIKQTSNITTKKTTTSNKPTKKKTTSSKKDEYDNEFCEPSKKGIALENYTPDFEILELSSISFSIKWLKIEEVNPTYYCDGSGRNYKVSYTLTGGSEKKEEEFYTTLYRKISNLTPNTEYTIAVKLYKEENGKKIYSKTATKKVRTLSENKLSSSDKKYLDSILTETNSHRQTKFVRDTTLDKAAMICAESKSHSVNGMASSMNERQCIARTGFNMKKLFSSNFTTSTNSSKKLSPQDFYNNSKNKKILDSAYKRIGIGYYENTVFVIVASYCEDVDTSGLNTNTCQ